MRTTEQQGLPDETFRAIVESSVSPFVIIDSAGVVSWAGPRVEVLLGEPADAYVGRHFLDMMDPSSHEAAIAAFGEFVADLSDDEAWIGPPMVFDLLRADGSLVSCEVSASMGTPFGIDGAVLQVRRSRGTPLLYEAIDALAVGAPLTDVLFKLAALCEHDTPGSCVVIAWDWDGERFGSATPFTLSPAITKAPPSLDRPGPSPWHDSMVSGTPHGGGHLGDDYPGLASDAVAAGYSACWVMPISVRDEDRPSAAMVLWRRRPGHAQPHRTTTAQRVARLVAFAIESDRNTSQLHRAATTDDLTGLGNRLAQREVLARLLQRGEQTSVLFCDLDGFKPVNDDHGHDFGDRVLAIVAQRMQVAIRSSDHLSRWGGDEFVVTSAATQADDVTALADRLIATVSAPISVDGVELAVGLSIGVATASPGTSADQLLQRADDALRDAKVAGKGRWVRSASPEARGATSP